MSERQYTRGVSTRASVTELIVQFEALRQLFGGGDLAFNATGATQTVLTDGRIGANSFIQLMAKDAAAATTSWHVSAKTTGSATIDHAGSTSVRTFDYFVFGR